MGQFYFVLFNKSIKLQEAEAQAGNKSIPGRGVTLQMLLEEKMLEPGNAAMTIEYLVCMTTEDLYN